MYYHTLVFSCPKCDEPTSITDILATSTGIIRVDGACLTCNTVFKFATSMTRIMANMIKCDMAMEMTRQAEIPQPAAITSEDAAFLHDMHITEGGESATT